MVSLIERNRLDHEDAKAKREVAITDLLMKFQWPKPVAVDVIAALNALSTAQADFNWTYRALRRSEAEHDATNRRLRKVLDEIDADARAYVEGAKAASGNGHVTESNVNALEDGEEWLWPPRTTTRFMPLSPDARASFPFVTPPQPGFVTSFASLDHERDEETETSLGSKGGEPRHNTAAHTMYAKLYDEKTADKIFGVPPGRDENDPLSVASHLELMTDALKQTDGVMKDFVAVHDLLELGDAPVDESDLARGTRLHAAIERLIGGGGELNIIVVGNPARDGDDLVAARRDVVQLFLKITALGDDGLLRRHVDVAANPLGEDPDPLFLCRACLSPSHGVTVSCGANWNETC